MSSTTLRSDPELPAPDDRLVAPNTRYEIEDGRVVYVPPADEPHGESHACVAALVRAHRAEGYSVAVDMLTRTSRIDDFAPDVSLYPTARDPVTGGRQLEELVFEIASSESLAHAGKKTAKLIARGVRRGFAIDLERMRVLEWSAELGEWSILDLRSHLTDRALAVPVPIAALLDAARTDDAIPVALRAKHHPEFVAERAEGFAEGRAEGFAEGRAEGMAEAVITVLSARGLIPQGHELGVLRGQRDLDRLGRWLAAAATCESIAELLAIG